MQVLVALARAQGAVVSRDELIRQCWDGQVVGDDAINRSVKKVRALADISGEPAFEIETVPRVGYRLIADASVSVTNRAPAGNVPPAARPQTPNWAAQAKATLPWRTQGAIVVILLALALLASIYVSIRQIGSHPPHWEVAQSDMIVSSSLRASWPAISPDGKTLAYSAGANPDTRNIYLRRMSGGLSIRLTNDSYDDSCPAWSPDASQLAYVTFKTGQPCRLMVISALGGVSPGNCCMQNG